MKISNSKRELARIISENGGWRDGYGFSAQDGDDCAVWFYDNAPVRSSGAWWVTSGSGLGHCGIEDVAKLPNWHQTILSRDEYFHLYPAPYADGWIEWKGGECPVDNDSLVDVKFPDGSEYFNTDAYWDWSSESDTPISHYRQSKKVVKPEFCESVARSITEPESIDGLCAKVTEENKHQHVDATTIEQLAADYRNAKDYAERKQQEADEAKADVGAKLKALEIAGEAHGLLVTPITAKQETELVITELRDLRVGDEVKASCRDIEHVTGKVIKIDIGDKNQPVYVSDGIKSLWATDWKFIRRP